MLHSARQLVLGNTLLRRLFAASRWIFGPAALVFLIVAGVHARGVFRSISLQTQLVPLVITVLLWASLNLLAPIFSWLVLRESGAKISYSTLLKIQVGRLPARYLPGGIWQTVSRMTDLHRLGVDRSKLSLLVVLENLVPLAITLTMGGFCTFLTGSTRMFALAAMLGGLILLTCLPIFMRHRLLSPDRSFSPRVYLLVILTIVVFWCVAATAFSLYWYSFTMTNIDVSRLRVYGAYLIAWSVGFMSVISPQGIGVFESVLSLLLKGALPFSEVAVLAAGFRAATLAADLIAYGSLLVWRHFPRLFRLIQN